MPQVEIYSDIFCPFAYLAVHRLRQVRDDLDPALRLVWRALSLEYINARGTAKPLLDAERQLFAQIDPTLPFAAWTRPDWEWPVTAWPAFEMLACAQAQSPAAAFEMSWALRRAFFAEGRSPSLRHELFDIARGVGDVVELDVARLLSDWDHGRYKSSVIAESRKGWHTLQLGGSPTFVFKRGQHVVNPCVGAVDFDEGNAVLRSYEAYPGDPLEGYLRILARA